LRSGDKSLEIRRLEKAKVGIVEDFDQSVLVIKNEDLRRLIKKHGKENVTSHG